MHGLNKHPPLEHPQGMLCSTPVPVTTSGIIVLKPSENHMSTCTKDMIISTTMDEEIMVKLAIVTAGYNTEVHIL